MSKSPYSLNHFFNMVFNKKDVDSSGWFKRPRPENKLKLSSSQKEELSKLSGKEKRKFLKGLKNG